MTFRFRCSRQCTHGKQACLSRLGIFALFDVYDYPQHGKDKLQAMGNRLAVRDKRCCIFDSRKSDISKEQLQLFKTGLTELTRTERLIYDAYLEGKSTKEIMGLLEIKENTLKFHNKIFTVAWRFLAQTACGDFKSVIIVYYGAAFKRQPLVFYPPVF